MNDVETVLRANALNGEGPTWSERERALYWVDNRASRLHRFDPTSRKDVSWKMPTWIGCLSLSDDGVIVALRTGLFLFLPGTGALEFIAPAPYDVRRFTFNDGRCDRQGRFFAGTMNDPLEPVDLPAIEADGTPLWRYDGEGRWTAVSPPARVSNGLAWSPEGGTMYHSDTSRKTIWAYDYDEETGTPENRRVFARVEAGDGNGPDGASVDRDGFYICAVYGEGHLLRFDPDGRIERRIKMPARYVTMPNFGGEDLGLLYVTSATWPLSAAERRAHPDEGSLFALEAPSKGLPHRSMDRRWLS